MVSEAEKYGMPVLAVTAVGRSLDTLKEDPKYLGLACRMAAEHGAHVVKTYYCQNGFEEVTSGCPVPVVMAGGKDTPDKLAMLQQVYNAVSKGAVGVDMGRNIFQSDDPVNTIKAVRKIIHNKCTVAQAYAMIPPKDVVPAGLPKLGEPGTQSSVQDEKGTCKAS